MTVDDLTVQEIQRAWHFIAANVEVQTIIKDEALRLHAELCPLLRKAQRYAPQITISFTRG